MSQSSPRVSILFPVLNAESFLRQTLDTVVSQTFHDWELIAMDGESKDGTLDILREYSQKDSRIRVFSSPDENGFHAISKAAKYVRGEFVCILAASDGYLHDTWLAKCMEVLDKDPEVSLVWGIPFQMSEEGELLGPNYVYAHFLRQKESSKKFPIFWNILRKIDLRKPSSIVGFFKKVNSANAVAVSHMLKTEAPPQKEEWFYYWLRTGTIFPDGNMVMSRKAFFECFPTYEIGTYDPGNFGTFNFAFNAGGYLAYCLPIPANFGRAHGGQVGEKVKEYNDQVQRDYLKEVGKFRKKRSQTREKFVFLDRAGAPISDE